MPSKIIPPTPCCCGFCGRTHEQVRRLIRGVVGAMPPLICDGCIEAIYLDLGLQSSPRRFGITTVFSPEKLAPENRRVLIYGRMPAGHEEVGIGWKDRIDGRWYFAPRGGLVPFAVEQWCDVPEPKANQQSAPKKMFKLTSSFPERAGGL